MSLQPKSITKARDVMSRNVVYIDGMATVREAAELMRSEGVDVLLVSKRNPDDAVGIVAVQDLITKVLLCDRSPESVNVYEIMTKPVVTVPADMDIKYVARMMVRVGIRRAPVEESGTYKGMVSLSSLILEHMIF